MCQSSVEWTSYSKIHSYSGLALNSIYHARHFGASVMISISQKLNQLAKCIIQKLFNWGNFAFFKIQKISNFPKFITTLWFMISRQKGLFW